MPRPFTAPAPVSDKPYVEILMAQVRSNQIACIGYDASTKTLAVQFSRNLDHVYHYPNVEPETHEAFMAAESKGKFFGEHIKPLPFDKFSAPSGNEDQKAESGD
ncbi:KTSC domain-containing protein [Pseudacidovorax intermedius]|uniref:KTSC domain-containing protein n=1 Tax=Pseudacidovorax intermedius TaxID=433924 RepID=UPI00034C140F|nr:KTSC domain-containing protein [Pseudacidovorax intermedius]